MLTQEWGIYSEKVFQKKIEEYSVFTNVQYIFLQTNCTILHTKKNQSGRQSKQNQISELGQVART